MKLPARYFRAGVGAVILDAQGLVLALERSEIPDAWQMPQGGWEKGETAEEAVFREIQEETGLTRDRLELIDRLPEPLAYELPAEWQKPKTGLGQVLYWYLFRLRNAGTGLALPPDGEFRAWRWMPMEELIRKTSPFRRTSYQRLRSAFRLSAQ